MYFFVALVSGILLRGNCLIISLVSSFNTLLSRADHSCNRVGESAGQTLADYPAEGVAGLKPNLLTPLWADHPTTIDEYIVS